MNEGHKNMIIQLAKTRTEEQYELRLNNALSELNQNWALWLDQRKEEFTTVSFLERGIRRFGKVTSNGVENVNSALVDIHSLPVISLVEGMVKYQREKYYLERSGNEHPTSGRLKVDFLLSYSVCLSV
jgi:hypothetical protein